MTQNSNGNGGQRPPRKFENRGHRSEGERRFENRGPRAEGERRFGNPNERRPAPHQSFGFGRVEQDAARLLAFNVLEDVTRADAFASLALSQRLRSSTLNQRDRGLVSELVYGTLERRITLDYLLDQRLRNPDIDPALRDLLRLGAYQILYLDRVPDSAAVDETVKLCRVVGKEPFTAVVNAVLRTLSREKDALEFPDREKNFAYYLSITQSMPE